MATESGFFMLFAAAAPRLTDHQARVHVTQDNPHIIHEPWPRRTSTRTEIKYTSMRRGHGLHLRRAISTRQVC